TRRAARSRPGHGSEDPRLPPEKRCLQLGRRPRCDPWNRAGANRAAPRRRSAVILRARPHLLAGCLCVGLAAANGTRETSPLIACAAVVLVLASALAASGTRIAVIALALLLAGWWWGSARLDALDRSVLLPRAGSAGPMTVAVTGPARRSRYDL